MYSTRNNTYYIIYPYASLGIVEGGVWGNILIDTDEYFAIIEHLFCYYINSITYHCYQLLLTYCAK